MIRQSTQTAKKYVSDAKTTKVVLRDRKLPYRTSAKTEELKKEFAAWDALSDESLSNVEKTLK